MMTLSSCRVSQMFHKDLLAKCKKKTQKLWAGWSICSWSCAAQMVRQNATGLRQVVCPKQNYIASVTQVVCPK